MVERNRSTRDTGRSERTERGGREGGRSERGGRESSGRGGSKRDFVYHKPSADEANKRSEQRGGADFDSMFKDGTKVWKLEEGNHCIRIVPATWEDPKHFGYDIFVHWNVGPDKESYLCPKEMNGDPCPLCEERARAVKEGDDDYAKELTPKKRVLIYLIDRDNEKEGVQAWSMPWGVDRDINALIVDKRTGEVLGIDDPDNGYDVEFKKKGTGIKTEYIGMQIARRESDIGKDEWLEYAQEHPLPDILKFFSYDHMADSFGGASSKKDDDDDLDRKQDRALRDKEMESSRGSRGSKKADDDLTWEGIHEMTYDELCDLIDAEKLATKPDDSKNDEELADWVCEDMQIEKKAARTERARSAPAKEDESPRDRMKTMRRKVD